MSGSIYSRSTSRIAALLTAPILLSPALASMAFAGSATWSGTGTTDWNVTTNWTPAAIPNGPADIATFRASFTHSISLSASTQVNGIVFASSATSPYTITTPPAVALTISG